MFMENSVLFINSVLGFLIIFSSLLQFVCKVLVSLTFITKLCSVPRNFLANCIWGNESFHSYCSITSSTVETLQRSSATHVIECHPLAIFCSWWLWPQLKREAWTHSWTCYLDLADVKCISFKHKYDSLWNCQFLGFGDGCVQACIQ